MVILRRRRRCPRCTTRHCGSGAVAAQTKHVNRTCVQDMCVCVCARVCVCMCVYVRVCVCVCVCVRARMCVRASMHPCTSVCLLRCVCVCVAWIKLFVTRSCASSHVPLACHGHGELSRWWMLRRQRWVGDGDHAGLARAGTCWRGGRRRCDGARRSQCPGRCLATWL